MGSDSSIFMTRAVFLSLLFHVFVLSLMSFFLTLNPPAEVFPKIKVYFTASAPDVSGSESQNITVQEEPVAETVRKAVKEVVSAVENLIPSKAEIPVVEKIEEQPLSEDLNYEQLIPLPQNTADQKAGPIMQESTQNMVQPEEVADPQVESFPDSEEQINSSEAVVLDGETGEIVETPGTNNDSAAGSRDSADLEWTGGPAVLRTVPEPNFQLPYNAILPDTIMISFRVQSDGTVRLIKILPPGSGHVNLDQQIRTYVNSFIFDSFDSSEEDKIGLLRLSLRERGGGGI